MWRKRAKTFGRASLEWPGDVSFWVRMGWYLWAHWVGRTSPQRKSCYFAAKISRSLGLIHTKELFRWTELKDCCQVDLIQVSFATDICRHRHSPCSPSAFMVLQCQVHSWHFKYIRSFMALVCTSKFAGAVRRLSLWATHSCRCSTSIRYHGMPSVKHTPIVWPCHSFWMFYMKGPWSRHFHFSHDINPKFHCIFFIISHVWSLKSQFLCKDTIICWAKPTILAHSVWIIKDNLG